jgi:hypothetical protein
VEEPPQGFTPKPGSLQTQGKEHFVGYGLLYLLYQG